MPDSIQSKRIRYDDIADLYDTYVQTDFDIPFWLEAARNTSGAVLELMAGTGRISIPLLEAGVSLSCVDLSPEMLAILRQKVDARDFSATLHQMDVCELDLGQPFELIILPFNSFAELLSPAKQQKALARIRSHLSPNGRFICTLHNPHVRLSNVDGKLRLWNRYPLKAEAGTLLFWGMETYDPDSELVNGLEFFEIYNASGVLQSKRMVETRFRLISKPEFETLATSAGFECLALYGNYDYSEFRAGASPYMIWMLG
ncbi:MAG: class I SAM-dependent methyltransferase [Cyanobacteria bacterium J06635_1]